MGTGLRLELRQSQQLVMTPQLQQAIKLLQMSNLELSAFVDAEIERNPLLIREDGEPEGGGEEPAAGPAPEGPEDADRRLSGGDQHALAAETFDTGAENLYDAARAEAPAEGAPPPGAAGAGPVSGPGGAASPDGETPDLEGWLAAPESADAHLAAQIGQMRAPPSTRRLAEALVWELDEDGYFRACPAEVADRLGAAPEALEEALALLRRCEPTGVGARDLADCLALQLAERDRLDPAMRTLLDNLAMLAEGEAKRLRALCGVEAEDFAQMLAELRALDPRPLARFRAETPETVVPDVFLSRGPAGEWRVELNADTLPRVLIDRRYAAELAKGGEEERRFVSQCRDSAGWLVKSLDQRARTILAVATEIARHQEAFFEEGIGGLKPLGLRQIAEAIGMHESTVSRVTANKHIATARGVLPFKFFFTNAVGAADMSAERVRHRLQALIDAESTPESVLSDDRLVEILRGEGIEVARRTIAKYRKSLKIPSSVERRRRLALASAG
jgi:RNA polymerase sigma-54 factor